MGYLSFYLGVIIFISSSYKCLIWYIIHKNFSPILWVIFTFLIVSFEAQKILIFIKFNIPIFCCAFGVTSKNPLLYLGLGRFTILFSFKSFIVFAFTFRSLIYFELIVVYSCEVEVQPSFLCIWKSSCPSTFCWRDYFPHRMFLTPLLKISCDGLFLDFQTDSISL